MDALLERFIELNTSKTNEIEDVRDPLIRNIEKVQTNILKNHEINEDDMCLLLETWKQTLILLRGAKL